MSSRPNLLRRNQDSLIRQTCDDWQQTLLIDHEGRGVSWANRNLAAYAPQLEGEYIWILDDDDICVCKTLVEDIARITAKHDPDVIMVRGQWMQKGPVIPDDCWQELSPEFGSIGMSNYVVRRIVWQENADAFRADVGADYQFACSLFAGCYQIYWHDVMVFEVPTPMFGAAE